MADKLKTLRFDCPSCGTNKLEIIEINVVAASIITELNDSGDFEYDTPSLNDGEVSRYQCFECGYILKNEDGDVINDNFELVDWLEDNCVQSKG